MNARSRDYCCNGKELSITYSESVYVAVVIQHSMRMRHTAIYGLYGSTLFFQIISQTSRFSKKKKVTKHGFFPCL